MSARASASRTADLQAIWDALTRRDPLPEKADVIVVGGCSDPGLAERAAEVYHAGIAERLIISGYRPSDMTMTEAQFLADACAARGVPDEAMLLEPHASNTGENILFSARMAKQHLGTVRSVVLVHKPYMSLRFLATAQAQWPEPRPRLHVTCQSISFAEYCRRHPIDDVEWKMLGDFRRMTEYADRGYQTPQDIPGVAQAAYERLVGTGVAVR